MKKDNKMVEKLLLSTTKTWIALNFDARYLYVPEPYLSLVKRVYQIGLERGKNK